MSESTGATLAMRLPSGANRDFSKYLKPAVFTLALWTAHETRCPTDDV